MTLADLLQGRLSASGDAGAATTVADMGAGRFAPQLQRDFRDLGQPLQNFDGGLPGESQWFQNLTPNMRRNYGHDWPSSPLQQFAPPPMLPNSRMPTHDPSRMDFWPWLAPTLPPGYPRPRGRA